MPDPEYEVAWPLHTRHYLNVATHPIVEPPALDPRPGTTGPRLAGQSATPARRSRAVTVSARREPPSPTVYRALADEVRHLRESLMSTIPDDDEPPRAEDGPTERDPSAHARQVAALAFRIGARCPYERVGAFLGISARSVRRDLEQAPARPPDTRAQLDEARTLIATSVDRGSEPDERAAALAWLEHGRVQAVVSHDPAPAARGRLPETETLQQLQRRILHRSEVIAYVLARTPDLPLGARL